MNELMITVAPTGAESSVESNPNIPITLDEIVEHAIASEEAGAAMVHVHVRDDEGRSSLDLSRLKDTMDALHEKTDLIVQLSTGGSVRDSAEDRLRVLDLAPESCSLTCGTVNFGDSVFQNSWPFIVELFRRTLEARTMPEFELFDLGHVSTMLRLLDTFGLPYNGVVHCDFVLGVPGGLPGTPAALHAGLAMLPPEVSWSATGVGRSTLPIALAAVAAGGQLRVGMEDVLKISADELVKDNAQLVARAVEVGAIAQRYPVSPARAREILQLDAK